MSMIVSLCLHLVRRNCLLQEQKCTEHTSNLKLLLEDLLQKKASVYRSIPYSRLGSNRDAHCYRKAYPHLLAFKVSLHKLHNQWRRKVSDLGGGGAPNG